MTSKAIRFRFSWIQSVLTQLATYVRERAPRSRVALITTSRARTGRISRFVTSVLLAILTLAAFRVEAQTAFIASVPTYSPSKSVPVGEWVQMSVTARNSGTTTASVGYISISFPALTGNSDGTSNVEVVSSTRGSPVRRSAGQTLFGLGSCTANVVAQHAMAELEVGSWAPNENITFVIRFRTATANASFPIRFRHTLVGAQCPSTPTYSHQPTALSGGRSLTLSVTTDQQSFNAYVDNVAFVQSRTVTVTPSGGGIGAVTSSPAGIDCRWNGFSIVSGSTCQAAFTASSVSLSQTTDVGSFDGWSGACSGRSACSLTMTANRSVGARWTLAPSAELVSFGSSATTVAVGSPVTLTIQGRNDGSAASNPSGYMSIAFRDLTGSTAASQIAVVSATNGGNTYSRVAGEEIVNISGSRIPAQYLLTEFERGGWAAGESNTYAVRWTPTQPGTYIVEGKVAMQIDASSFDRVPTSGSTDQQGAFVQRLTITVTPPVAIEATTLTSATGTVLATLSTSGTLFFNGVGPTGWLPYENVSLRSSVRNSRSTVLRTAVMMDAVGRGSGRTFSSLSTADVPSGQSRAFDNPVLGPILNQTANNSTRLPVGTVDDFDVRVRILDQDSGLQLLEQTFVLQMRFYCRSSDGFPYLFHQATAATTGPIVIVVHGYDSDAVEDDMSGACRKTETKDYSSYFGLAETGSQWNQLRSQLIGGGREIWVYRWPTQHSMESAANNLVSMLAERSSQLAGRPVYFVGHSMGGLVATLAASQLPSTLTVPRVITLGTPHNGLEGLAAASADFVANLESSGTRAEVLAGAPFLSFVKTRASASDTRSKLRVLAGASENTRGALTASSTDGVVAASSGLGVGTYTSAQWVAPLPNSDPNEWRSFVAAPACHSDINMVGTGVGNVWCPFTLSSPELRTANRELIRYALAQQLLEVPPPQAQLVELTPSSTSVTLGSSVLLSIRGRNSGSGPTNPAGYMSIAFRELTSSNAASQIEFVTATNGGSTYTRAAGQSIVTVGGGASTAQYLLTEFERSGWAPNEENTLTVRWTPTAAGTYTIEGRIALQVSGNTFHRAPASGPLDQQGAATERRTITVVAPPQLLAVDIAGNGSGSISSSPAGIACTAAAGTPGGDCSESYAAGTVVTLTAVPAANNTITLSGACNGGSTCQVTMDQARTVTATFTAPTPPPQLLTIAVAGAGSGSVSSSPAGITCSAAAGTPSGDCSESYAAGTVVTLTAVPATNNTVTWSGACTNSGPCQVTMDQARTVTATFTPPNVPPQQLSVAVAGTGSGSVTSSPAGIACTAASGTAGGDCSESYAAGTVVTLTAAPASNNTISWSGACNGESTCQVTMDQARTVTATFTAPIPPPLLLTISVAGTGSGSVSSSPAGIACTAAAGTAGGDCSESYAAGTVVTLSATPSANHTFAWSGACTGSGICQITMDQARAVTASFATPSDRLLSVGVAGVGSGSIASAPTGISCTATAGIASGDCSEPYAAGTVVTLTAVPAANNTFAWSGACAGSGSCQVTMDQARTVTATFTPISIPPQQLSVTVAGGGSGSVTSSPAGITCTATAGTPGGDCTESYAAGTVVTLTAVPAANNTFTWSGPCNGTGSCQVTMDQARTVTATFTPITVPPQQLSVTVAGSGSGSVTSSPAGITCTATAGTPGGDCTESYAAGTVVTLTAVPAANNTFTWSGPCTGSGSCQVTMDQARTVTATFAVSPSLTISVAGFGSGLVTSTPDGINCTVISGAGSGDCAETYASGTLVTLVATPAANQTHTWSGACTGSSTCQVSMTAARNVTVAFVVNELSLSGRARTHLATGAGLSLSEQQYLDARGNADGLYNLGDYLALLSRLSAANSKLEALP